MNAQAHRLIFDRARGMFVAVAEFAPSAARSGRRASSRSAVAAAATAALLLTAGTLAAAQDLPTGGVIVRGAGTIGVEGNAMLVKQDTSRMVADWTAFSIGAGSTVRFAQPSSSAVALNRVVGNDASHIFGSLLANGHVYLQNANGVLFAPGAQVHVGSLVATSLNADLDQFMSGVLRLGPGRGSAGDVVNEGRITVAPGGHVVLAGPVVANHGDIEAPGGTIGLAAGSAVSVDATGAGLVSIQVPVAAVQARVTNSGRLVADGGTVDLQSAALDAGLRTVMQVDGLVRARRIENRGGQIVLSGGRSGVVQVGGALDVSSADGVGGQATVLGQNLALLDGSRIDASGSAGGGSVQVGGSARGQGSLPNAQAVFMATDATITADATQRGQGGSIVLWSDKATRAYGHLSARGGPAGGDGGFIETSGGWLDARPASVRTDAPAGRPGLWLLDPNDILIDDGDVVVNAGGDPDFTTTDDAAVIGAQVIANALNNGNNVTIATGEAGSNSEAGDITMSLASIFVTPQVPVSLTLTAHRNIDIDQSNINGFGSAPLSVYLYAGESGVGGIRIVDSTIAAGFFEGSSESRSGGLIYLGGNSVPTFGGFTSPFAGAVGFDAESGGRSNGVEIVRSTLSVGRDNGVIQVSGNSIAQLPPSFQDVHGVLIASNGSDVSTLEGADVSIRGWVASDADRSRYGVRVQGQVFASQILDIRGEARSSVYDPNFGEGGTVIHGVELASGSTIDVGDSGCGSAFDCALTVDGISEAGAGTVPVGGAVHASGLVVDGAITLSAPADVRFSGVAFGGDPSAEWAVLFDGSNQVDLSAAAAQLNIDTTTGSPSPTATYSIGLRGDVLLPTGGDTLVSSQEDVFLEGAITGAPATFTVTANTVIHGRGNALSPPAQSIALTGGAEVTFDAPEVRIGSTTPGNTFDLSTDGPVAIYADALFFRDSATLTSSASGDAVVFAGSSGAFIQSFAFEGATGAELGAPSGRWLIYATDPAVDFDSGLLPYAFRQYNAGVLAPVGEGNGLLFEIAPTLTASLAPGVTIGKVYDATVNVPGGAPALALSGFIGGDNSDGVGPTYNGLAFVDKNVGVAKPVTVVGLSLPPVTDGNGLPVYGYGVQADVVGDISAATLALSGVSAQNKTYDATTAALLAGTATVAPLGADVVSVAGTGVGAFADKNVGTAKPVTVSGYTLAGADAGNYTLLPVTGLGADITAATLSVSGLSALDKVYDGTTTATLSGTAAVSPFGSDVVTLAGTGVAAFSDRNAGLSKPVSLSGLSLAGADAANYVLSPAGLTASITPRPLLPDGVRAIDRVSNGDTRVDLDTSSASVTGVLPGDTVDLDATAAYGELPSPDPGRGRPVTLLGFSLGGPDSGNYQLDPTPFAGGVTVNVISNLAEVFERLRYNEYLQGVSDAQEPFRRAMAEALAAGFGKENIRKRLSLGLVFETGLAAPAIEDIQPAKGPEKCSAGSGAGGAPLSCP